MQPDSPDASRSQSMWGKPCSGTESPGSGKASGRCSILCGPWSFASLPSGCATNTPPWARAIERSRMPADEDSASDFEERIALRLKQIAFLREEIGFLVKEQKRQRQGFEQQRLQHLGLKKETGETGDDLNDRRGYASSFTLDQTMPDSGSRSR